MHRAGPFAGAGGGGIQCRRDPDAPCRTSALTVRPRTRAPLPEAHEVQAALVRHLLACRAPLMLGATPEPHLTTNYRGDRLRAQKIATTGWTVDEILLIESIVGKATHVPHGRWPLRIATSG